MKLSNKDLEELLTIAEQCKVLIGNLNYQEELIDNIFKAMKKERKLTEEDLVHSHNNFLAQTLIGFNNTDLKSYQKINNYLYGDK